MIDVNVIKGLVDAGTVVICLMVIVTMWKAYNARIDAHIADLKAWREITKSQPPFHSTLTPSLN